MTDVTIELNPLSPNGEEIIAEGVGQTPLNPKNLELCKLGVVAGSGGGDRVHRTVSGC